MQGRPRTPKFKQNHTMKKNTQHPPSKYDIFISYSQKDGKFALELAEKLKKEGFIVWIDQWELKPGDHYLKKINEGLALSRSLVLIMSKNLFKIDWIFSETQTLLFRDPTDVRRKFIPLLAEDC